MNKLLSIFILLTFTLMMTGCNDSIDSVSPDDEISEYLCDELEGVFTYFDKTVLDDNAISYTFHGWTSSFTEENITLFLNATKAVTAEEGARIRINLIVGEAGGHSWVCSMSNYYPVASNGKVKYVDYSEMCVFSLGWPPIYAEEIHNPTMYTGVKGVRYLFLDDEMMETASKAGVDWNEIWPQLEGVEVISSNNWHN